MVGMAKRTLRILLGDRPVAYHPILARVMESAAGGIWLSQILYWDSVKAMSAEETGDEWDGWFYKSEPEIIQETALTRRECQTSKSHAKKIGIVETEVRGLPPTSHYRVNFDVMEELIEHAFKSHTVARLNHTMPGKQSVQSHAQNHPQITHEITTENTQESTGASRADAPAVDSHSVALTSNAPSQGEIVASVYANNASSRNAPNGNAADDTARQFDALPSASAATVKPSKRKGDSALYDIASALAEVSGWDFEINKGRIFEDAKRLSKAAIKPTAELIKEKYSLRGWWYTSYWLGRDKCESPTPAAIVQTWGQWAKPNIIPFNKRQTISETLEQLKTQGKEFAPLPERDELDCQWQRVLAQLELSMPKEVFNAWYRNTRVMGWADFDKLAIDVRSSSAKEWIEKRGVEEINKAASGVFGEVVTVYLELKADCGAREAAR